MWIEKPRDYCIDGRENGAERTMSKVLRSGGAELVDEGIEVRGGNVRHKRTLKRKYVKRKGEGSGYVLRLTFPLPRQNLLQHQRTTACFCTRHTPGDLKATTNGVAEVIRLNCHD